jgi:hypothetical protein
MMIIMMKMKRITHLGQVHTTIPILALLLKLRVFQRGCNSSDQLLKGSMRIKRKTSYLQMWVQVVIQYQLQ